MPNAQGASTQPLAAVILLAAVTALGAAARQELPAGAGREVVAERCVGCHGLDTVTGPRLDRPAWTAVVDKMIENGARLDGKEREAAVAYLSVNFGPPPNAPPVDPEVERTARRYIDGICSSCHRSDLIAATRATRPEWLEIVVEMNGRGAGLSEADVELLADYLSRRYPPE